MARAHHRPPLQRLVRQILGWTLLTIGTVGLIIPVMPHTPFILAGMLLLAPYVRVFRRMSAWLHRRFPQWRGPLRRFRDFKHPPPAARGKSPCKAPGPDAVCADKNGDQVGGTRT